MRKTLLIALSLTLTITMVKAQAPATIRLTDVTLMHYNPQIEMFARFKMKSSFHKTKRII